MLMFNLSVNPSIIRGGSKSGGLIEGFGSAIPGVRHSEGPPFRGIIVIITLYNP